MSVPISTTRTSQQPTNGADSGMTPQQRREREAQILAAATPAQQASLREDRNYGTPYSFWRSAVSLGYATEAELEAAQGTYGDIWHYRGD